jgi:hypothetical protein
MSSEVFIALLEKNGSDGHKVNMTRSTPDNCDPPVGLKLL